jgi:hypothetical protein
MACSPSLTITTPTTGRRSDFSKLKCRRESSEQPIHGLWSISIQQIALHENSLPMCGPRSGRGAQRRCRREPLGRTHRPLSRHSHVRGPVATCSRRPGRDSSRRACGFRRTVTFGLPAVPRVPGPRTTVKQKPGREMPEFRRNREADAPRFASDGARSPPPEAQQKISGRLTSDDVTQNPLDIRGYNRHRQETRPRRPRSPGAVHARASRDAPGPADLTVEQKRPAPPSHPVTRVNAYRTLCHENPFIPVTDAPTLPGEHAVMLVFSRRGL